MRISVPEFEIASEEFAKIEEKTTNLDRSASMYEKWTASMADANLVNQAAAAYVSKNIPRSADSMVAVSESEKAELVKAIDESHRNTLVNTASLESMILADGTLDKYRAAFADSLREIDQINQELKTQVELLPAGTSEEMEKLFDSLSKSDLGLAVINASSASLRSGFTAHFDDLASIHEADVRVMNATTDGFMQHVYYRDLCDYYCCAFLIAALIAFSLVLTRGPRGFYPTTRPSRVTEPSNPDMTPGSSAVT